MIYAESRIKKPLVFPEGNMKLQSPDTKLEGLIKKISLKAKGEKLYLSWRLPVTFARLINIDGKYLRVDFLYGANKEPDFSCCFPIDMSLHPMLKSEFWDKRILTKSENSVEYQFK